MAGFRHTVKGDSNQANEEFSHNRITVNMGSSGVIAVCFLCALIVATIAWMIARQGTLFSILIVSSVIALFLGGGAVLTIVILSLGIEKLSNALTAMRVNKILERTVVSGEVVAYRNDDNQWDHLSAEHVRAGVPPLPMKELPSPNPRWDAVLDLRKEGRGMHAIAKDLKVPYNQIRTFLNQVEHNESEV